MSDEFCSQEKVVKHLENNSPTKFMFSFGKAPRFPKIARSGKSDTFYDLPTTIMKRTTCLGFGNRYDFTKSSVRSEFISIKRDYDIGNQPGLKYSFGLSKECMLKKCCPGIKVIDKDIPGPGKYSVVNEPGMYSPRYTIHIKCGESGLNTSRDKSPGPGAYSPTIKINNKGKYPLSQISNVLTPNFGNDQSKRFFYKSKNIIILI